MPYLFKDRDLIDQLSMGSFSPLNHGLIGPDVGLIATVNWVRQRANSVPLPSIATQVAANITSSGAAQPHMSALGFGLTKEDLFHSACGEFIERYSSRVLPARFEEFPVSEKIPVSSLAQFTAEQYQSPGFSYVNPAGLEKLAYTRAFRASDLHPVAVPAALTYLIKPDEDQWCAITSNGLASGKNFAMAARAAIFELIERDTFMRSWHSKTTGPRMLLPETLPRFFPTRAKALFRQLELREVTVSLIRLQGVGGIPVVLSCVRSPEVGLAVGCAVKTTIVNAAVTAFLESLHTYNWALDLARTKPRPQRVSVLEDHVTWHAAPDSVADNAFLDSGSQVSEAEFLDVPEFELPEAINAAEKAGWDLWLSDVRSSDTAAQGWHVIRALSPQAATLEVDVPHLAQHPQSHNPVPHPFP